MISTSRLRSLVLVALLPVLGCLQGEGEVCQVDDNCSGNLVCCGADPNGSSYTARRGECLPPGVECSDPSETDDMGTPSDLGPLPDMSLEDLGPLEDLGADDLGTEDMSLPEDLGADDLGTGDMGADDMGAADDMGPADLGA